MSDYRSLKNQPLRYVLAEFRFSPVMHIVEYIPRLQDALRKQYPIQDKRTEQAVRVQPGGIAVSSTDRWTLISGDKKSAIDINQERLVYTTADYPRFHDFSDNCKQAVETLAKVVEPSLILRIGLRYSNLVTVDETEHITDLVNDHFGLPDSAEALGAIRQHSTDTLLHTHMGGLAIRTLYGKHNLTCLPDLQGLPISIAVDETPSERIILDFDHYWEAKDASVHFETDVALGKLTGLHETSREAFWTVTTDYARNEKWA